MTPTFFMPKPISLLFGFGRKGYCFFSVATSSYYLNKAKFNHGFTSVGEFVN